MDYEHSDLPWCANCSHGHIEDEDGERYVFCDEINIYRMEDDFCGCHEWKNRRVKAGIV